MTVPLWLSYSLVTLVASLPFYWYIWRNGGASSTDFPARFRRMLWIPAIIAIGFRLSTRDGYSEVGFGLGRWPFLLIALLLPLSVELLTTILASLLRWGQIPPEVVSFEDGAVVIGDQLGLLIGGQKQSIPLFAINLLLSTTVGAVYTLLFSFGQEFGWRGYLQPMVEAELGRTSALIITGLVWGGWLLPLVLMGYRFVQHSRQGAFILNPIATISLSVIAGWLYISSGSIWAPALLHAGVLVSEDISEVGLGTHGGDLRVRLLWLGSWVFLALVTARIWV